MRVQPGDEVTFVDRHDAGAVTEGIVQSAYRDKWIDDLRVFVEVEDGRVLTHVHGHEVLSVRACS